MKKFIVVFCLLLCIGSVFGQMPRVEVPLPGGSSLRMRVIPGGTFMMGGGKFHYENPRHQAVFSSYLIGETEVTQEQWRAVANYSNDLLPFGWFTAIKDLKVLNPRPSHHSGNDLPVERVSWNECASFCFFLSFYVYNQVLNNPGKYPFLEERMVSLGHYFRPPTEAEWEFAAKGGGTGDYSGSGVLDSVGWWRGNSKASGDEVGSTRSVGGKSPNGYGLYDMSGNVWEWCYDYFGPYPGPVHPGIGSCRKAKYSQNFIYGSVEGLSSYRGGSFASPASDCLVVRRHAWGHERTRSRAVGFRLGFGSPP